MIQYFFQHLFSGTATILTGAVVVFVYYLQKGDEKKKAARVVLMEIRNAENKITEIKDNKTISSLSVILSSNSWSRYNHFFVKELDRDELDLVNSFYGSCSAADQEILRLNNYLPIAMEEKSKAIQNVLLELAEKYKGINNNLESGSEYLKEKEAILKTFHKEDYWFLPKTPQEKLISYIQNIRYITTSSCGQKLKKIAGMR